MNYRSMKGVDDIPDIENPHNLDLPPVGKQIIKTMFAGYQRVVIRQEFGSGFSGGRVLEVQPIKTDETPELPVVVKLAAISLIQNEWQSYEKHIHRRLPFIAEVGAKPVLLPEMGWGGLCYTLMGAATFEVVSLHDYCAREEITVKDVHRVVKRLLKIMHHIWSHNKPNPQFQFSASYDRLLPVNLLIQHQPTVPVGQPYLVSPDTLPATPLQVGDQVRVSGFAISKVNPATQTVTLNRPASHPNLSAYHLRWRSPTVEQMVTYQAGQIVESLEGEVIETRLSKLQAEIQRSLGDNFDTTALTVQVSDQLSLPNPLLALDMLLNTTRSAKIASIHGDFHLQNILVEPETGMVSLIDFADSRQDHILHDFLRLETEVITQLLPKILNQHHLLLIPTLISLYQQLHATTFQATPDRFYLLHPALKKPLVMLLTIRQTARQYFFDEQDPREYYQGLVLYLIGALKFKNLEQSPERPLPKQAAFWGATLAYQFLINNASAMFEAAQFPQPYLSFTPDELYEVSQERLPAPFQALHQVPQFVGRERDLANLCELLTQSDEQQIICVTGMGGVGKTSLVVQLAHILREAFPDGVLWANVAVSEPLAILDSWARAYNYDFSSLSDLESRAATFRSALADKKALLILDDVWSAEQIRPLLPGSSGCVVLVTTRNSDLAVALDSYEYRLSVLSAEETRQLLVEIIGHKRVLAEAVFADEIGRVLGYLPLAVKLAAQRLASRQRWRLVDLSERLRDEKQRLAELKLGDREVRASFAISWNALDPSLRRVFGLLAVFGGRPFTVPALATVAQIDRWATTDRLDTLVALSLVTEEEEQCYRQHPLLADFAREHLGEDDAAFERMTCYYLDYAREHQRHYIELEKEGDNLLAGMRVAYQRRLWQHVIDYANVLVEAWFARARFSDMRQGCHWACEAAEAIEDRAALATALCQWGRACIEQADYAEAGEHLSRSLELYQELNNLEGVANTKFSLGRINKEMANFSEARQLLDESRAIRTQLGDQAGVAETLYLEADIPFFLGNYEESARLGQQALNILQQTPGNELGCIRALGLLADVAIKQKAYERGEEYCQQALALCEAIQEQGELAVMLYILAEIRRCLGELQSARNYAEQSLALLIRMGDRKMQAWALSRLSMISTDLKDYDRALSEGEQSLKLQQELNNPWNVVHLLRHLGDIHQLINQADQAHEIWSEALILAQPLEHPLIDYLQTRLGIKG